MTDTTAIVHIIDDDASIRAALADLLDSVGIASMSHDSADAYLAAARPDCPSCLVLDVRMPGASGLELQTTLRDQGSTAPIIFITAHGDVPMSVRAMKNGAIEFLQKPFSDQTLLDAVRHALALHTEERKGEINRRLIQSRIETLSEGEKAVLRLVLEGKINKQIAFALSISEVTVKVRRSKIMKKLKSSSLPELIIKNYNLIDDL